MGSEMCIRDRVEFAPVILRLDEFTTKPETWNYSLGEDEQHETLEAGTLAFSLCAVPVVYRLAQEYAIQVYERGDSVETISGNQLDRARSQSLFQREGRITRIVVDIPEAVLKT